MKKTVTVSFVLASLLVANETTTLDTVTVTASEAKPINISVEEKIAEEAGVDLKRTTGKIQEVTIHGLGGEDISVTGDGATTHGACPNRMDPPLAHIVGSKVEKVEVVKGPYDVRNFGAFGGSAEAKSKELPDTTKLEVSGAYGSYKKTDLKLYGGAGNEQFGVAVGAEKQSMGIYKDGGGNYITDKVDTPKYKNNITDKKLYDKQGAFVQAGFVAGGVQSVIEYDAIKTDHALFPNKGMDETKTDTTQKSLSFKGKDGVLDGAKLKIYENYVDHVMDNHTFRKVADPMKTDAKGSSTVKGLQASKKFSGGENSYELGGEYLAREWDIGRYTTAGALRPNGMLIDTETTVMSLYGMATVQMKDDCKIEAGLRVDSAKIEDNNQFTRAKITSVGNSYSSSIDSTMVGGYIKRIESFGDSNLTIGIGSLQRLVAPNEAYIQQPNPKGTQGNPDLKNPRNTQLDVIFTTKSDDYKAKIGGYYAMLTDYIYQVQADTNNATYKNIDATMYGVDLDGQYFITDDFSLKGSVAYQVGQKDKSTGGTKNLANIPPLRYSIHALYEANSYKVSLEMDAATKDTKNDKYLNEVDMDAYEVFNLRFEYKPIKSLTLLAGVENLFDKEYAKHNSYSPDPINPVEVVLPEPSRTFYGGVKYVY